MKTKPIVIVGGEPNSIFFEIFYKALKKNSFKNPIILIGSKKTILKQFKVLKFRIKINLITIDNMNFKSINNKTINLINIEFNNKKAFNKISNKSNLYIDQCFKIAFRILKKYECSGLINGPVSKKNFLEKKFLGITEYLANNMNKINQVAMLLYNKKLSVCPITTHLPISDVYKNLSKKKIITQALLIQNFYLKNFNKKPKIAITGLNPHCETNRNYSEEDKIIKPAINFLRKKKLYVSGPFPADTIFMKKNLSNYDIIIGMYHDQILTPFKTLFGFDAINITLGLPFIRITPDHGPNEKMLGKNLSNPESLIQAIKFLDK